MMKTRHSSFCAGAAIAAVLALGSTPAVAQFAETTVPPSPVIVDQAPPPIFSPAPVMSSSPVVQAVPDPEPVVEADEPAAAASAPPARARAVTPRNSSAAMTPVPIAQAITPDEPVAVAEPLETVAPVAAPVETTERADGSELLVPAILGGLAVLALAIWGFVAIGRRRPLKQRARPPIERPVAQRPPAVRPQPQPVAVSSLAAMAPAYSAPRAQTSSLSHSGAAVALPRAVPATFDERNALIDRMVAARPDRANPFTSPIQRRKRAKLILQSLGRDFGDAEPWIDLSQYTSNWPELPRRNSAAA